VTPTTWQEYTAWSNNDHSVATASAFYTPYGALGADEPEAPTACDSGWRYYTPPCVAFRSQQYAAETGEQMGKSIATGIWNAVRIPLLIGGVLIIAGVAVNKAAKARKR
jgi:hypothetical protein